MVIGINGCYSWVWRDKYIYIKNIVCNIQNAFNLLFLLIRSLKFWCINGLKLKTQKHNNNLKRHKLCKMFIVAET